MPQNRAFIAVGSNIDPHRNVCAALDLLVERARVLDTSSFYRTAPLERPAQDEFANGVFLLEWNDTPRLLKEEVLRKVEQDLGRERTNDTHAARAIDLDIALFGDEFVDEDVRTRSFVAIPIVELAPEITLPDSGERLADMAVTKNRVGLRLDATLTNSLKEKIHGH